MEERERGRNVDRELLSRPVSWRGALVLLGGSGWSRRDARAAAIRPARPHRAGLGGDGLVVLRDPRDVHFELFPSVSDAVSATNTLVTSQLALPEDVCDRVYATSGYEQSSRDLSRVSLSDDMVFSDGVSSQTPSMTGNVRSGYVSSHVVGVSGTV
jgi:hypothetical protein